MKKNYFLAAAVFMMLFSCNSGSQNDQAKDTSAGTATTDSMATVTAPVFMPFDIVRLQFKVKNYAKWHEEFMSHDSTRLANGIHKYVLDRGLGADSNMVIVVSKIDDAQKVKAFYSSSQLKTALHQTGIVGTPKFLHVIQSDTTEVSQDQRVSVTHHVKDFDAWKKVYDSEGKDTRAANGLIDRAMARGIEDPNIVSVVFVITDMAKAKARIASPDLKKLMTDGGVDSTPEILFYRIAEKF
ncbi:MAG: hypothetical protein ABI405_13290 [Parafilimonas sp.]